MLLRERNSMKTHCLNISELELMWIDLIGLMKRIVLEFLSILKQSMCVDLKNASRLFVVTLGGA